MTAALLVITHQQLSLPPFNFSFPPYPPNQEADERKRKISVGGKIVPLLHVHHGSCVSLVLHEWSLYRLSPHLSHANLVFLSFSAI